MQRIVVGIDGSDTARNALRWALDEARLRQAAVEVIQAWQAPYPPGYPLGTVPFSPDLVSDAAREMLNASVDAADTSGLPTPVERSLVCDNAAAAVLEAAKGADLVVVGSRGLGGFSGLLLGSVSHQITHHASCPVVVVPPINTQ